MAGADPASSPWKKPGWSASGDEPFGASRAVPGRSRRTGATTRWPRNGSKIRRSAASSPARWRSSAPPRRIGSSLEAAPRVYVADRELLATLARRRSRRNLHHLGLSRCSEGEAPADAFRLDDVPGVARRGREGATASNARARGRSCRPSAATRTIPTSRRATPRRCANGRRGVSVVS